MVADVIKADRRATLMLGKPVDSFRYLTVPVIDFVQHLCNISHVLQDTVTLERLQPKPQVRITDPPQPSPRLLKVEPWWDEMTIVNVLLAPLPVLENDKGMEKAILSPTKMNTNGSEEFSRSKALNVPASAQENTAVTNKISKLLCKQHDLENNSCMKTSQTGPMKKKHKHRKPVERLLKVTKSLPSDKCVSPDEGLSQLMTRLSSGRYGKPMKHCPLDASIHHSLMTPNSDVAAENIIAPNIPLSTLYYTRSAGAKAFVLKNLSSATIPVDADDSFHSSVEIIQIPQNGSEQNQAATGFTNKAPAPLVHQSNKPRTIRTLNAFLSFKNNFPRFASAIENFEIFLQNDLKRKAGNIPKNMFAVVSYFVHKTGATKDFDWEFVCLNLAKMITIYIANHSEMMPIGTLKRRVMKAFRRLSSYLHQMNSSTEPQFLRSFSKDAFKNIIMNAVQHFPDHWVTPLSPTKQTMVEERRTPRCPDKHESASIDEVNSLPTIQRMIDEVSTWPSSDNGESPIKDEMISLQGTIGELLTSQCSANAESPIKDEMSSLQGTIGELSTSQCSANAESPIKDEMISLQGTIVELSTSQCSANAESPIKDEMISPPPIQGTIEQLSSSQCSANGESPINDEMNLLPPDQELLRDTPLTAPHNQAAGIMTNHVPFSVYPIGNPNFKANRNGFLNFKRRFPSFVDNLEEYKVYLHNNGAQNVTSANFIVKNIYTVMSSYVEKTPVTEDFDWKFICVNIHNILEKYIEKHSEVLSDQAIKVRLNAFHKLSSYLQHLEVNGKCNFLPFFSVDVYNDVVFNVMHRLGVRRAKTPVPKSPLQLEDSRVNLHEIAKVLLSDYVMGTLDGVAAYGIAMEPLASQIDLIGLSLVPDDVTPLVPSYETACRVQSVLMLISCLRNGCRSSKLSTITLKDFSRPTWIDSCSVLFRPKAYEATHGHPSYVWWTAAELRVLQYYLLHYRQRICTVSDPKSPLFPSPSRSQASGCTLKSEEMKISFDTVLREVGSPLDASCLQPHLLEYIYFSEMQHSGLTNNEMSDLAWSLGHIEAHAVTSSRIGKLRKVVQRTITNVENVFTKRVYTQERSDGRAASKDGVHFFLPKLNKLYPLLSKRTKLIAGHRHVLSTLNLRFDMPDDEEYFLGWSERRRFKASHRKKKANARHFDRAEEKTLKLDLLSSTENHRKRGCRDDSSDVLPDGKRFRVGAHARDDRLQGLDEDKRLAVIDWLVKMP